MINLIFGVVLIGCIFAIIHLYNQVGKLKSKERKVEKGEIILPAVKEMPSIEDVDPEYNLLKDVIESAKSENWIPEIKPHMMLGTILYSFFIKNNNDKLFISCNLTVDEDDMPRIGGFVIGVGSSSGSGVSYRISREKNEYSYCLVLQYLWDLILKKNESDYNSQWNSYLSSKNQIEKELTSLRRNKQLEKLFENNSEI